MFKGVFTAVITPFKNGRIDYDSYSKIIEKQIAGGVSGIVPCGTTGESPTLDHDEHTELISKTVALVNKRVLVVAGTGSNSTDEAVHLSEKACKDGVDGILSVNPYYNKPTQEGLYQHFRKIAETASRPVMLYNIPGRTGVNLLPETVKRLTGLKNIAAIKEASGDLGQMAKVINLVGDKITVLSGDDNLTLPLLSIGGKGVVSVVSNLFPASVSKMVSLFIEGKIDESRKMYYKLLPIFNLAFCETNPIPVKAGMSYLGYCSNELRLPMTELSQGPTADEWKKSIFTLKEQGFE